MGYQDYFLAQLPGTSKLHPPISSRQDANKNSTNYFLTPLLGSIALLISSRGEYTLLVSLFLFYFALSSLLLSSFIVLSLFLFSCVLLSLLLLSLFLSCFVFLLYSKIHKNLKTKKSTKKLLLWKNMLHKELYIKYRESTKGRVMRDV